jgi:hypothetical protein
VVDWQGVGGNLPDSRPILALRGRGSLLGLRLSPVYFWAQGTGSDGPVASVTGKRHVCVKQGRLERYEGTLLGLQTRQPTMGDAIDVRTQI